jgi:6,7-dimethyl-8-ribityllumazine synthase
MKIALVVADFNSEITHAMEKTAREHAAKLGLDVTHSIHVPGVYDMATIVTALLRRKEIAGVVMIGAVIKGETTDDELISHAIASAALALSVEFERPVGLTITGPGMTDEQAEARVPNARNGVEAVARIARALEEVRLGARQ